jgi:hypothetical protein
MFHFAAEITFGTPTLLLIFYLILKYFFAITINIVDLITKQIVDE